MFHKKILFLIIIVLLSINSSISAISTSSILPGTKNHLLEYTLIPDTPQPNQLVTLELRSYHFDMNSTEIFIYIDNKLVKNEMGLKKFIFQAPDGNVRQRVTVIAEDIDGKTYRQDIIIKPVEVTLVYEVEDAYKPIFYQGKAYALSNSKVRFKAFADFFSESGGYINPNSLIYDWYVNFTKDFPASGYGKKIFTIERLDAYPIETVVQVKVTNSRKDINGSSALFLVPRPAIVDFYAVPIAEPFRFENILKNNTLIFNELNGQIRAIPYFMDGINNSQKSISYEWGVNGRRIFQNNDRDFNLLDVTVDQDSDIRAGEISLSISGNRSKPFQNFSTSFQVRFIETKKIEDSENIFNRSGKIDVNQNKEQKSFFGLF